MPRHTAGQVELDFPRSGTGKHIHSPPCTQAAITSDETFDGVTCSAVCTHPIWYAIHDIYTALDRFFVGDTADFISSSQHAIDGDLREFYPVFTISPPPTSIVSFSYLPRHLVRVDTHEYTSRIMTLHIREQRGERPLKRRRIEMPETMRLEPKTPPSADDTSGYESSSETGAARKDVCQDDHAKITLSASSKHAGQTVAPFLAKHIPEQYAPGGGVDASGKARMKDPDTKFCYRHRPDLKCRRQANEPSMEQLQHELEDLSQGDQQAIAHVWSLFSAAPAKQRNLMLQGILTQCCFPQLSYLSANVRDLIRIDFLTALPPEISYKVLCFLDTTSLCKAAQVSQRWRSLADDDVVWHRMCEQHIDRKCTKCGWGLPLLERKRLRASKRQIQLRATGRGLNEWSPNITPYPEAASEYCEYAKNRRSAATSSSDESGRRVSKSLVRASKGQPIPSITDVDDSYFRPRTRPWKDVYKDRFRVGTNWKHGRCSVKVFKGHTNGVMCLQMCEAERMLATGSYDSTIKIWNIDTGEEIRTIRGHTSGIRSLQFDSTKLISGGLDRTVKVWNWRTGELVSTYTGHNSGIVGLHFDGSFSLPTNPIPLN